MQTIVQATQELPDNMRRTTPLPSLRHPLVLLLGVLALARPADAQPLDKGHRLILDNGLQIQGVVMNNDLFHLDTFTNANFTAPVFAWYSHMPWLGPAPGNIKWGRWLQYQLENDITADEEPYRANLLSLSVGDEQNLNDPAIRDATVNWFTTNKHKFPDTILHVNNWGGQIDNPSLGDFIVRARPDMLSFDTYPFRTDGDWLVRPFYAELQRYRKFANGNGIPFGIYLQTFHDSVDRDPSESEMRMNQFAAWTFGAKLVNAFAYNFGAGSLFTAPGGDSNPNARYTAFKETARQSRNLGPALTRLKSTDVRFIVGQKYVPPNIVNNPLPIDVEAWTPGAGGDPYLASIGVRSISDKNNGLRGDVIVGYFKVLAEEMDGDAVDQTYFMITNGLTDTLASAALTRQEITLNFDFGSSGITSLQRLNRLTGLVETLALTATGGTKYQYKYFLEGGTGDLFKYDTGAPFVGFAPIPEPAGLSLLLVGAVALAGRRRG